MTGLRGAALPDDCCRDAGLRDLLLPDEREVDPLRERAELEVRVRAGEDARVAMGPKLRHPSRRSLLLHAAGRHEGWLWVGSPPWVSVRRERS